MAMRDRVVAPDSKRFSVANFSVFSMVSTPYRVWEGGGLGCRPPAAARMAAAGSHGTTSLLLGFEAQDGAQAGVERGHGVGGAALGPLGYHGLAHDLLEQFAIGLGRFDQLHLALHRL